MILIAITSTAIRRYLLQESLVVQLWKNNMIIQRKITSVHTKVEVRLPEQF